MKDDVMLFKCQDKYIMACIVEQIHKINKSQYHWAGRICYAVDKQNNNSIAVMGRKKYLLRLKHALYARHGIHIHGFYNECATKEVSA